MKEYVILGLLAVWILGLAIAFIAGMIHDYKNKTYEQTSSIDQKSAKKRILYNVPFIIFGIFLLIFRTYLFGHNLSTNSFLPGLFFVTTSAVQVILGFVEMYCSKK